MGYDNENAEPLVLDIETMPREGIDAMLDVPAAPANYKDPQKILDVRVEKLKTLLDRAALDIYLNQIIAIGTWSASRGGDVVIAKNLAEERFHLAALALVVSYHRRLITFNGLGFDLPNLQVRASFHRLDFPTLNIVPKWRSPNTDLMEVLTFGGLFAKHSLDFYCAFYGIDSDEPDEVKALHGADIPRLAAEGKWDLIAAHCRHDVTRTALLAQRVKVIPQAVAA